MFKIIKDLLVVDEDPSGTARNDYPAAGSVTLPYFRNGIWRYMTASAEKRQADLGYTASSRTITNTAGDDAVLSEVVASGDSGLMTGSDKAKLNGIATSATANSADATPQARSGHTGTQTLSTISDAGSIASKGFWTGTQSAYDAIGTPNANTIYFVE